MSFQGVFLDQVVTPPAEPVLPKLEDLSSHEYREVREKGTPIADVVKAREPEPVVDEAAAQRARDEATGRFVATDGEPKPKQGMPPAENPRHSPKARVHEVLQQKTEAERERDELRAENARLKAAQVPPPAAAKPEVKPEAPVERFKFRDYDAEKDASYEEYMEDRAVARIRHEQAQEDKQQALAHAQTESEQRVSTFRERHATFVQAHPDFADVAKNSPVAGMPAPPWIEATILDSAHGPALQYHLLQHPDEFHALVKLPERAAVYALGKLEASLTAALTGPAAVTRPTTQADPPLEPVGGSPNTATHRSLESIAANGSAADFRRAREAGRH